MDRKVIQGRGRASDHVGIGKVRITGGADRRGGVIYIEVHRRGGSRGVGLLVLNPALEMS